MKIKIIREVRRFEVCDLEAFCLVHYTHKHKPSTLTGFIIDIFLFSTYADDELYFDISKGIIFAYNYKILKMINFKDIDLTITNFKQL